MESEDTTPYQDRVNELIEKYPVLDALLAEFGEEVIYNIAIEHIAVSSLKARHKAKKRYLPYKQGIKIRKNRGEILESVFRIFKNGSKPWKIVVTFYAWLPLRLQFWLEKQNWHPDNITFKQWLESSGYKSTYPYR